jgi:hypothetical protein
VPRAGLGLDFTGTICLLIANPSCQQLAFLENLSSNPQNTVIGIVRNVAETEVKVSAWERSNVHIIHGDMNDYDSLKVLSSTQSLDIANR